MPACAGMTGPAPWPDLYRRYADNSVKIKTLAGHPT